MLACLCLERKEDGSTRPGGQVWGSKMCLGGAGAKRRKANVQSWGSKGPSKLQERGLPHGRSGCRMLSAVVLGEKPIYHAMPMLEKHFREAQLRVTCRRARARLAGKLHRRYTAAYFPRPLTCPRALLGTATNSHP